MGKINLKLPMILISLSFGMMSFFLPIYSKAIGLTATEIGGMFSVVSLIVLVLKPMMGKVSDSRGRKPLLVIAMLLYGISFYLLASASTATMLYIIRIIQGIAAALMGISTYAMLMDVTDEKGKSEVLGEMTSVSTIGMMIGSGLSFWILFKMPFLEGWYRLFILYAIGAIVAAAWVFVRTPETKPQVEHENKEVRTRERLPLDAIKLTGIGFFISLSASMLAPTLLVYLQDYFTKDFIGLAYTYIPSMLIYSMLPKKLGKVGDKYGRVKVIIIGVTISGITVALIPSVNSLILLMCLWCIDAIGSLLEGPARTALFSQIVGEKRVGESFGVYSAVRSVGAIIGPLVGGMAYDYISPKLPFYLCSLGFAIAVIGVWAMLYPRYRIVENLSNNKED